MKHIVLIKHLGMLTTLAILTGCGGGSSSGESRITTSDDPLYSNQWHLKNTIEIGEDINVEPVWNRCTDSSCRGENIRIAVVDDGLELTHEDLAENIVANQSYNYVNRSTVPASGEHGTSVAGLIAARDSNNIGVRGVAPRAKMVAYDLLSDPTSANETDAMTRDAAQNHISNNSWGIPDGSATIEDSYAIWRTAIDTGHTTGRNGLGIVYVWAAGNGYQEGDNSNYDGYANYRGVIAVGAVNRSGQHAYYSEQGANLLVSAPGGEDCTTTLTSNNHANITTTDLTSTLGYNTGSLSSDYINQANYTACFNGTSAAAPIVSGVVALILQANPNLGWRDVHAILAHSARQNDPSHPDWKINGAGLHINHSYGFGVVDTDAAVSLAEGWTNLGDEKAFSTAVKSVNQPIEDNTGIAMTSTLTVTGSGISNIEFVEIRFSASDHAYSGDLEIILTNQTTGTTSRLAETHWCDACVPYNNWRFGSTRHLGESADGDWILTVKDKATDDTGTFESWQLIFYGT